MKTLAEPVEWGCEHAACYWLSPSTLPTLYTACPKCGGKWVSRKPRPAPLRGKQRGKGDAAPKLMPD